MILRGPAATRTVLVVEHFDDLAVDAKARDVNARAPDANRMARRESRPSRVTRSSSSSPPIAMPDDARSRASVARPAIVLHRVCLRGAWLAPIEAPLSHAKSKRRAARLLRESSLRSRDFFGARLLRRAIVKVRFGAIAFAFDGFTCEPPRRRVVRVRGEALRRDCELRAREIAPRAMTSSPIP